MEQVWLKRYADIATTIDEDCTDTVVDLLDNAVQKFGDKPAFHCLFTNLRYSEVDRLSRDFAAWLQSHLGLEKGERVAVMMPNLLAFPVVAFGLIRAGLVQVNVNPMYTPRELAHQLKDAGCKAVVVFNGVSQTLAQVIEETPVEHVIGVALDDLNGMQGPNPPMAEPLRARATPLRLALIAGRELAFKVPLIGRDDPIFLQYTGGTTGLSKGAVLSHRNLVANVAMMDAFLDDFLEDGKEVIVTALPLYHIFALTVNFLLYFKAGALNVLIPNARDMPGLVREWSKWRVTAVTGVNTLFAGLMHTPGFAEQDFSGMKLCMGGGAPMQKAVSERWKAMTGCAIREGYGLSETSPVVTSTPSHLDHVDGTVGIPTPSTDLSIRDDEGHEVALGEPGELCVKGPQVMSGYWNRPDANADVFTEDGYFRTGDIATVDADGLFRIVDRKKDMILVSGFNVFPNEIEDALAALDGVLESACVGVPDEKTGEAVKVVIVKKDPALTEAQVIAHCRGRLTAYKVPRIVVFTDQLPKSTVGKILRRALRDDH